MASKQEAVDNSAIEAPKMASLEEQPQPKPSVPTCKYSKRVVLKTLLEYPYGGLSLVGERIVIGGWVKSSKEVRKMPQLSPESQSQPQTESGRRKEDVTCTEILQSRVPLFWSFMNIFGLKDKALDSTMAHQVASDVILEVNDGSCPGNLQVKNCFLTYFDELIVSN